MDATSVWLGRFLTKKVDDIEATLTRTLTSGAAADYPHYRFLAGQLNAYAKLRDWIKEADPDERHVNDRQNLTQKVY